MRSLPARPAPCGAATWWTTDQQPGHPNLGVSPKQESGHQAAKNILTVGGITDTADGCRNTLQHTKQRTPLLLVEGVTLTGDGREVPVNTATSVTVPRVRRDNAVAADDAAHLGLGQACRGRPTGSADERQLPYTWRGEHADPSGGVHAAF